MLRITIAACFALMIAGCGGADVSEDVGRINNSETLPNRPVNPSRQIYETTGNTVYFEQGPHQIQPPGVLPPGTRVEVLDRRHGEPGYVAIRTSEGLEAYIANGKLRSVTAGPRTNDGPVILKARRQQADTEFFESEHGWF